ncbi:hypothetical protein KPH14_001176 [Odynerus spinipes]|uniref:NF-kappa-B inhibitor zeta n=1 Tax=Odynerus spinipes TaxID=1348599 RepID=A0AAD9RQ75_9HYME|nr:hypothetical protein KPH14_001176 [Odynerus spinipes]
MTNSSTIRHVKIDEASNRSANLNRSIVHILCNQHHGKDTDREMSTVNGQQSEEQTRFTRQEDKRVAGSCRLQSPDFREMNANLKRFDNVINDVIEDLRAFQQSDSSYERIADLQEFLRERSIEDKRIDQPAAVDTTFNVFFERRSSFNDEKYDQDSSDGPMKFKYSATRNRPYSKNPAEWSPRSSPRNQSSNMNFTRKQQNVDRSFLNSKDEGLDVQKNGERSILDNDWSSGSNEGVIFNGVNTTKDATTTSIPSIVVNDHGHGPVLTIPGQGGFQGVQVYSDASNNSIHSLTARTWVDSPLSCYNVAVSRPNSRCSSRAQSPGSGIQLESQLMPCNVAGSPLGSPQIPPTYMATQGQSSPSSSSQSYSDTPSPLNYQTPLSQRMEEQLHEDLACFSIWGTFGGDGQQGNTTGNEAVTSFDSNELQLVDEVLRDLGNKCEGNEDAQVVPSSSENFSTANFEDRSSSVQSLKNDLQRMSSKTLQPSTQVLNFYDYNSIPNINGHEIGYVDSNALQSTTEFAQFGQETSMFSDSKSSANETNFGRVSRSFQPSIVSSTSSSVLESRRRYSSASELSLDSSFNEFQIPEMVSSFKPSRPVRSTERNIIPWPSLNLPSIGASERLKEELNPKDVEKAMISLLKKSVEELARGDEDGDTELMRLVGNPEELARKKAYLVPLVERLSNVRGALSMTNNRGEDALYLAAMNCPEMPYIAGYLAATMLEKGIDISQKLYHTRGDSLIHSIAARGDSHGEVLAELLALKTTQGNAVFDLSKRNYDGRTALHVAVESHDLMGRGPKAVATVRLLLDNGADPNVKETKCGDTALHMAASLSCDPALVKVLLDKVGPAIVNVTDYNYNTPLHMAAAASNTVPVERQKEVCWLLIQAGGQSNMQNRQGKTPLALVPAERKDLIKRIFYKKF